MASLVARLVPLALTTALIAGCRGAPSERVVARADQEAASAAEVPGGHAGAADRGGLVVDVAGAVRRPGVYRMPAGARVHEAIEAAGGARAGADLSSLNRAAPLLDGQQVVVGVPAAQVSAGPASGAGDASASPAISINAADATQLQELPGIGPVTAQAIVDERESGGPFASVDDLDRVRGVGPATIESLREAATT